ncbi:MAG: Prepilin-type N-terminal cleavage/methylation protein, partial [Candidatus Hydrogenedentes bacterium]|nr:Prepilin-type N-terminal cleavage/methylation protein [Candidatus Hydrogenedentota bacterium]
LSSNEGAYFGFLRDIFDAQTKYKDAHGAYADSFEELTDPPNGLPFLGEDWCPDGMKWDYQFTVKATNNGKSFEITASPGEGTGYERYFFVDSSGVCRVNSDGQADATSKILGDFSD